MGKEKVIKDLMEEYGLNYSECEESLIIDGDEIYIKYDYLDELEKRECEKNEKK